MRSSWRNCASRDTVIEVIEVIEPESVTSTRH